MSRPPGLVKGGYAFRPDDPEPCLGCKYRARCETGYACNRFAQWVNTGRNDPALSPVAIRSIFEQIFPKDGPAPVPIAAADHTTLSQFDLRGSNFIYFTDYSYANRAKQKSGDDKRKFGETWEKETPISEHGE
jgi:hypothetical protein